MKKMIVLLLKSEIGNCLLHTHSLFDTKTGMLVGNLNSEKYVINIILYLMLKMTCFSV